MQVRVEVVAQEGATPLAYSVVSVPARGIERFTDASGRVVLPLDAGRVLLRIKRLGFVPRDTTVEVGEGAAQVIRVALARVSFNLDPVRVVSWPPCRRPGIPRRGGDPQLRGIVDQLRQNAERYRLLTRTYPFTYESEREFSRRAGNGPLESERIDTILVRTDIPLRYRPGRLVVREPDAGNEWKLRIPSISDLADDTFVDNHCFHIAGIENKGDQQLLRIDIVAADRIASPDVNVSVWLDPAGFQLRHATFTLVKAFRFPHLLHVTSAVEYAEIVPFVPVMQETVTESTVAGNTGATQHIERQTIVQVTFTGARP